ncbi:Mannose glucose-specific lectin [Musa troglodytarum]|uniref:Mannose glucose-specific lectin n=1 Tax=Musa troglodytarum TaxID=320322 RepID=A0A9E7HSN3_9LILI|nr:Mannose glucose-specific lectin [Musa troglodytarum]
MHACVQAGAVIKVGKWGADGGSHWDTGPADHIKGIKINAAGVVDSITFMYVIGETADETPRYGGPGGKHNQIKFFDEEYLNAISGCIGEYDGTPCISQLTFTTNMGTYGPYGDGGGTPFNLPVDEGKIAGFYGRAGTYLIAIGAYLKPN